jgi:hypothetical protein
VFFPLAEAAGAGREISRMWAARASGVPIVNGYSGHESRLYQTLRRVQSAELDRDTRLAVYSLLRSFDVDTIIGDAPTPALLDPALLQPMANGIFRIPGEVRPPRIDRLAIGEGLGLVVTESGWSYPERNASESWVWSADRRPILRLPMDGAPRRQISFRARSQTTGSDELELWWKGRRLGVQPLDLTPTLLTFRLPPGATVAGWIELELRGPAPRRLPGNPDLRALSVCLFEIRVD